MLLILFAPQSSPALNHLHILVGDGGDRAVFEGWQNVSVHGRPVIAPTRILDLLGVDFRPLFGDRAECGPLTVGFGNGELAIKTIIFEQLVPFPHGLSRIGRFQAKIRTRPFRKCQVAPLLSK